jgi:hypothetical protein
VGPRAGLDTEVRGTILLLLTGIEHRSPVRPARNQTLYCLSYLAHLLACSFKNIERNCAVKTLNPAESTPNTVFQKCYNLCVNKHLLFPFCIVTVWRLFIRKNRFVRDYAVSILLFFRSHEKDFRYERNCK